MAHKDKQQVAAYNKLRREHGLTESEARAFCLKAATASSKGSTMGQVYERILNGTLTP